MKLSPLLPGTAELFQTAMFASQLINSLMQFSRPRFFFRGFASTLQVVVGPQAFRFDLCGQILQCTEQQIDGWLACGWTEQFPGLLFQICQNSLGTDSTAQPTTEQSRLQAFVFQTLFTLTQLIQAEGKNRFEQAAVGMPDQALKTCLIQTRLLTVDLHADLVLGPLATTQFDSSTIG